MAPAARWVDDFNQRGIPAAPVLDYAAALSHPQTVARGIVTEVAVDGGDVVPAIGNPVHLSRTPVLYGSVTSMLGGDQAVAGVQ